MIRLVSFVSVVLLAASAFAGVIKSNSDIDTYLSLHNIARAQHGACPLTWNATLASQAQPLADGCLYQNSGSGVNFAIGLGTASDFDGAMDVWMDEAARYDPSNPVGSHFTQLVWKNTTQVGCAFQSCTNMIPGFPGAGLFVCEYYPAGNVIGEFPENVQA